MMAISKRPVLRGPAFILIGGFCLALLMVLGTVASIWSNHQSALRGWEGHLAADARMLSAHAGQSIGAADLVLRGVADNASEYRVSNESEMRLVFGSNRIFEMLRESAKGLPQIDVMTIVGLDGAVLNLTRGHPPTPINLADRDYFQAHMKDPALEVYLSRPVRNRVTGTWNFYLARKIKAVNGETLGLILTGLNSSFFSDFYQSIGLDVSRISLFRPDGAILAQHEPNRLSAPDGQEPASVIEAMMQRGHGAQLSGPNPSTHAFDELVAFERNPFVPVGVSLTASREQVLREWEREGIKSVILGGAITTILMAATILLARLISQLEKARNLALSAVEAKTRFASNVSHELRTPMNAIIGGSYQLMQTGLGADSLRFAQIVSSSAQQLMTLINDILDYSYYEARYFRIEKAPFNVRDVISETIEMTRTIMSGKALILDYQVDAHVPAMTMGDEGRIKQVLLNLLGNAVKYTECGKVDLRVSYIMGAKSEDNLLVLQVRDTGFGISEEDQARIFQPFERTVEGCRTPGTGLGLTICKKLVEAMSGDIRLLSRVGEGTHFTVELPAPPVQTIQVFARQEQPDGEDQSGDRFSKSLRILVAEDVEPSRMLLTIMLEQMGHAVTAVENGTQAVQVASVEDFDLIMMDLQMPEMDGATATQHIRAAGGYNSMTPILAVSANADMGGTNGLTSMGFDDALLKPVTPQRLSFVIAGFTAQARSMASGASATGAVSLDASRK